MLTKELINSTNDKKLKVLLSVLEIPNKENILDLLRERGFDKGNVVEKPKRKITRLVRNFLIKPTDNKLDRITKSVGKKKVLIKIKMLDGQEKFLTYSQATIDNFTTLTQSILVTKSEGLEVSDGFEDFDVGQVANIKAFEIPNVINQDGGFFPYINKSDEELSKYQIYKNVPPVIEHCLIHSLELSGIDSTPIKQYITANIKKRDLKRICEILNIKIVLSYYDKNDKMRKSNYGKGSKIVQLALYKGHYFIHENRNLFEIRNLFNDGKFERNIELVKKVKYNHTIDSLDYIEDEQQLFVMNDRKPSEAKIIAADLETIVCEGKHKLLLSGYSYNNKTYILNRENFTKSLDSIIKKVGGDSYIIYYHNLKYDWNIMFKDIDNIISICEKDGVLYSAKIIYNKCKFEFRDFYKMLSFPLSKIPELLNLCDNKKEFINYELYTTNNRRLRSIEINKKDLPEGAFDDETVLKYVTPHGSVYTYRHIDHYKYYLNYDCKVLMQAMNKLKDALYQATGLNMYNYLTISSLADHYMYKSGVYKDVFEMKGGLREFVMKCVIGGRVCTKDNDKWRILIPLNDYDACSLYPSAMKRFPYATGRAKIITNFSEDLPYYCCKIKVLSSSKNQQIPFMTYKEDGKRIYTNNMDGRIIFVDKYTLEDYVEYHGMKYEFIEGVYWSSTNNSINDVIQKLYDERLKYKKTNQALQMSLKLLMNSSYGKTILKESKYKIRIVKDLMKYVSKNYNQIIQAKKYGKNYAVKILNDRYEHWNRAHIGCGILSGSKRIMNEVMGLANDNNITIYYQDTDSMHIIDKQVKELENLYMKKFNRELNGNQMGQFHCDFDFPGEELKTNLSIILGKKAYYDRVVNKIGEEFDHCRLKGVNKSALREYPNKELLYTSLLCGSTINFNLLYDGGVSFEFNDGILTRESFERNVSLKKNRN